MFRLSHIISITLAAIVLTSSAFCKGDTIDLYVSPQGSDGNPGTKSQPFATIQKARDAVRSLKSDHAKSNIRVYLREGTYRIDQTLVFGMNDGASKGHSITYAAYGKEHPVISSGIPIKGWTKLTTYPSNLPEKAKGNMWVAQLPSQLKGVNANAMFDGETELPRARGKGFEFAGTADDVYRSIIVPAGAVENWPDIANAEVRLIPIYTWSMNILPVKSYDPTTRTLSIAEKSVYELRPNGKEESIWIENVLAVLDEPGEWVIDKQNGLVYYWPKSGNPGDNIVIPSLTELVRVEGDIDKDGPVDKPVSGITFRGITFLHSNRFPWHGQTGYGLQHDWSCHDSPSAMVRFRGAENCGVEACRFTGGYSDGIRLDLYCQNNRITGNVIENMGGLGILLAGYGPGTKDVNKRNTIANNYINRIGQQTWHSPAIFVWQSGENRIANNTILNVPYTAIVVSGRIIMGRDSDAECARTIRWNEIDAFNKLPRTDLPTLKDAYYGWKLREPLLHCRRNVIEYNDISNVMQIMNDGNGVYISGTGGGNQIRRNHIHDCASTHMGEGIRCDDDQHDTIVDGNLLYNIGGFATGICSKGRNDITNNVIASPLTRTERGLLALELAPMNGAKIQRNVICAESKEQNLVYQETYYPYPAVAPKLADCDADYNLYWSHKNPEKAVELIANERKLGVELHSIAADPMFVDPAKKDFRFQPGSPALGLGVKVVDARKCGVQRGALFFN